MTGRPTAAPAYFPYRHESMAVVMAQEALDAWLRRPAEHHRVKLKDYDRARYERERRSARG